MDKHPTCKTCEYFIMPDYHKRDPVLSVVGLCKKILHPRYMETIDANLNTTIKEEYKEFMAVVTDGDYSYAALQPRENFYCPQHSELKL